MELIIDSSSSRTEWCLIDKGLIIDQAFTDGINPYYQTRKEISHSIRLQLPPKYFKTKIETITFYGRGCTTDEKKNIVKSSLIAQFRTPTVVESDMLGAARSLFQDQKGIACIIGTGSDSCFYDGKNIVKNIRSLGFILGDEGSGATLGKLFLSDCLKGLADKEITESFFEVYRISTDEILNYVYSEPAPNLFLASLAFFLADNIENTYVRNLVEHNINSFFERNLLQYDECRDYPISSIGTLAIRFENIVRDLATAHGLKINQIYEFPMQGLVKYHTLYG